MNMFSKKLLITFAMVGMMMFGFATIAMAYPNHTSLAWVDPGAGNGFDPNTLSGTAHYWIEITGSNTGFVGVNEVVIEFEDDIFASVAVSTVVTPATLPVGWTWSIDDPTGMDSSFSIGTTNPAQALGVGEYVQVWLDYTLQDSLDNLDGLWNEGHEWHQAVTTWEIDHDGAHGTSTEPVPEPATALLFGSGMALIGYLRKKD